MHFTNSHTLPKIAISLALLLGGANIAFAEESGGFVGIGVGYGDAKMIFTESEINETYKASANGASYGFVAGYKQFFNEYLGLRYYANVDLTHATFNNVNIFEMCNKFNTILVNYGVNVDFWVTLWLRKSRISVDLSVLESVAILGAVRT